MVPRQTRCTLAILGIAAIIVAVGDVLPAQDESLKPGINDGYKTQSVERSIARFENDQRAVVKKVPDAVRKERSEYVTLAAQSQASSQ